MRDLYKSVTNTTRPLSINITTGHSSATAVAQIEAESTSLSIGDSVSINMGFTDNHSLLFSGYVKSVERKIPEGTYTIVANDEMIRAIDYFIASTNPETPFSRQNIRADIFIGQILELAGITNYSGDNPSFYYAVSVPAEVNLVGAYDYCKQLADILAWHLYAKVNGQIRFLDRKPYVMGGDSSSATIYDHNIISMVHTLSERDLRNRVVVYGLNNVYAEAKATSPYLPAGFYKTTVIATDILDNKSYCQQAANYNLTLLNRLTESLSVEIEGNPNIVARDVITVNSTELGTSDDWYVFSANHDLNDGGYRTRLELRK